MRTFAIGLLLLAGIPAVSYAGPAFRVLTPKVPAQGLVRLDPIPYTATSARLGEVELARLPWGLWVPPCAKSGDLRVDLYEGPSVGGMHVEVVPAPPLRVSSAEPPLQIGEPRRDRMGGFGWKKGDVIRLRGEGFVKGMHVRIGIDDDQRMPATVVSAQELTFTVPLTRRRAGHWVMVEHPDGRMAPVPNKQGFQSIRHPTISWPGCPGAKPYKWR